VVYTSQAQDKRHLISKHLGADFSERLARRITELLGQRSVPCAVVCLQDELDPDATVKAAAAHLGAKQSLQFGVKHIGVTLNVNRLKDDATVTLGFRLWDFPASKTVWRTEATFVACPPLAEDVANQLFQELQNSGVL
jgi:hypothetical protein